MSCLPALVLLSCKCRSTRIVIDDRLFMPALSARTRERKFGGSAKSMPLSMCVCVCVGIIVYLLVKSLKSLVNLKFTIS